MYAYAYGNSNEIIAHVSKMSYFHNISSQSYTSIYRSYYLLPLPHMRAWNTQALYKSDWRNYMERAGITGEQQAMSKKHFEETRLWASFRAQTLARTVEGIMYYESALRLLARCEGIVNDQVCMWCML